MAITWSRTNGTHFFQWQIALIHGFNLPQSMYFPYMQLHNAFRAQSERGLCMQSRPPFFYYMTEVSQYKGFISQCHSMHLSTHLEGFPFREAAN